MGGWCGMKCARSRVRVGCNLNEEFSVKAGVYQGSCLRPLLLLTIPEALFQEFRTGCRWKNLYADDLVIITEPLEELSRTWSSGRPTWKERDFGSTWAKPRSWYLGQCSTCFRSLAETHVACVSRASAQIPFSVVVVPVGSTRKAVASIVFWGLMPASYINGALDRPDQFMADLWHKSQWVGRSLKWRHPSITLETAYPQGEVVNSLLSHDALSHEATSANFCTSSPPAHFPSPAVE